MYQQHWGLRGVPFSNAADERSFYRSATHEEALARLQFLVDGGRRVGLLLGPSGTGKSLVLKVLSEQERRRGADVALAGLLGSDGADLLWRLSAELGLNPELSTPANELWRRLTDRLVENRYRQVGTLLLLDDAEDAGVDALTQVTRLAAWDAATDARLTIVLAGRGRRLSNLGPRLLELAELRVDLEPWGESEVDSFLRWALSRVGREAAAFLPDAVARLVKLSAGIPRRVVHLAELALVAAAGERRESIDAETVAAASEELGVATAIGIG